METVSYKSMLGRVQKEEEKAQLFGQLRNERTEKDREHFIVL
jgi:hypothetical protein